MDGFDQQRCPRHRIESTPRPVVGRVSDGFTASWP